LSVERSSAHPRSAREGFATKPGAWGELAFTLPVFLTYQLGVVFLNVRNASDVVTSRLLELSHGDRWTYFGLTASIGVAIIAVFAVLGRGQVFRASKLLQIALEGAAYAVAMGAATSWMIGKLFAGSSARNIPGPFAGVIMSLGAGFYEELAFRAVLFGLGAKLLVWLFAGQRIRLVLSGPAPGLRAVAVMIVWGFACAAVFSGMHYVGSLGDVFDLRSFVARMALGLALTLVYTTRGFAAAVWTHALYDLWVLVL
jgi:membrane protease YdiL (CAAX protease family)